MSGPSSKPSHTGHLVPESPTHFYHCIPGLFGKSIGVLALSPTPSPPHSSTPLLSGFLIPPSFGGPNGNVCSRTLLTPSSKHTAALVQPSALFLQLCELSKRKKKKFFSGSQTLELLNLKPARAQKPPAACTPALSEVTQHTTEAPVTPQRRCHILLHSRCWRRETCSGSLVRYLN